MKKTIKVYERNKYVEKEVNYIPFRYIVAMLLTIFEIVSIIAIMIGIVLISIGIVIVVKNKDIKRKK